MLRVRLPRFLWVIKLAHDHGARGNRIDEGYHYFQTKIFQLYFYWKFTPVYPPRGRQPLVKHRETYYRKVKLP